MRATALALERRECQLPAFETDVGYGAGSERLANAQIKETLQKSPASLL